MYVNVCEYVCIHACVCVLVCVYPYTNKWYLFARKGRKEIVEILLEAGMDPNCFDSETGNEIEQLIIVAVYFMCTHTLIIMFNYV